MTHPMTFAEKALARAAGQEQARAGEIKIVRPAHLLTHDNTAAIIGKIGPDLEEHGIVDPDFPIVVIDHTAPASNEKTATNHLRIREYVRKFGVRNFFDVGEGICHQVVVEKGLAEPGTIVVGSDSHTCSYGAVGVFATGVDRTEAAALLLTGETWLKVPQTIRVVLSGELQPGVSAKDLVLWIIGHIGADGAAYRAVEFDGPGVANLTMDERLTVANMGIEMGAKIAVFPVDEAARDFLAAAGVVDFQALWADEGADYERVLEVDMGALEPVVAMPHTVDNVVSIGEAAGTPVHQLLLGTCTNGRLSDLAAAAAILRGKRIHSSVRLLVLPASRDILIEGMKSGVIADIVQAGGTLLPPGCGPCLGAHQGVLAPGERCLSTANRNFKGRMGCRDAEILLGSPETVAASALTGVVTDPREVQP